MAVTLSTGAGDLVVTVYPAFVFLTGVWTLHAAACA